MELNLTKQNMKKFLFNIFVLFNIISVKCNVFDWDNEFENSMFLDFDKTFELYWNIINNTFIDIGISCKTLGWCGIGISPSMIYIIYLYILLYYIFCKY